MQPVELVLLWHMHQPDYRNYETGEFMLPWVYLHAIKDYSDMAAHLEAHPRMKAVVNFVPVLLDQLEDYATQFASGEIRDPLLRLLAIPSLDDVSEEDRLRAFDSCFRSNHLTMMQPYPAYKRLYDIHEMLREYGDGMAFNGGNQLGCDTASPSRINRFGRQSRIWHALASG